MNFPNRGFYRGNLNAALKDYGVLLVPKDESLIETPSYLVQSAAAPAIEQTMLSNPIQEAKSQGFTGSQCSKCNSMRVVMTGHCETCQDCGETSSCG